MTGNKISTIEQLLTHSESKYREFAKDFLDEKIYPKKIQYDSERFTVFQILEEGMDLLGPFKIKIDPDYFPLLRQPPKLKKQMTKTRCFLSLSKVMIQVWVETKNSIWKESSYFYWDEYPIFKSRFIKAYRSD